MLMRGAYQDTVIKMASDKESQESLGHVPPPGTTRLNKYLAHAGVASRRKADELIKAGRVCVNGEVIREMGHRVSPKDKITFDGKELKPARHVYVLLNKPRGFITTTSDDRGRKTIMDLVRTATRERIYPVGRLDRDTSGIILLTNDGELAEKLSHPRYEVRKVYLAKLDKPLSDADLEAIARGIELEDGPIYADEIAIPDPREPSQVGIELHSGRNRIVRRIFEHLGYEVLRLDRTVYAGLTKKDVPRGKWRYLKDRELVFLKHLDGGSNNPKKMPKAKRFKGKN